MNIERTIEAIKQCPDDDLAVRSVSGFYFGSTDDLKALVAEIERLRKEVAAANKGAKKNAAVNELLIKRECKLRDEIKRLRMVLDRIRYYASDCGRSGCSCDSCQIVKIIEEAALGGEVR